ncbi:conserved Plasmodium protein, unknown function [Plasmodium relictum]|uniref:Uncharacterized protein n=1 Tax=Plasmodium relictum TaxID=85471 RepID=A0A1J1HEJ8_PLARL|nr:conserved Plasmodium protein, unknown function [Plasmodium relictum]CRH02308.1 conserved Plasmodium protein, unknown function [Plasmodium relictum]
MKIPLNDLTIKEKGLGDYSSNLKKKNCKIISYLKNKSKINFLLLNTKEIKSSHSLNNESSKLYFNDEKVINNSHKNPSDCIYLLNIDSLNLKNDLGYKSCNKLDEVNSVPIKPPGKNKRKEKAAFLNKMKIFYNIEENKNNEITNLNDNKNNTIRKKTFSNHYIISRIENDRHDDIKSNIYKRNVNIDNNILEKKRMSNFSPKELTINQYAYNFIDNYNETSRKKNDIKNNNSSYDNLLQIYEHKYLKTIAKTNRSFSKSIHNNNYSVNLLNEQLNNKVIINNKKDHDKEGKMNHIEYSKTLNSNIYEQVNNQSNLKHITNNNLSNDFIKQEIDDNSNSNGRINGDNYNSSIHNDKSSDNNNNTYSYKQKLNVTGQLSSTFNNEFIKSNPLLQTKISDDEKMNDDINRVIKSINTLCSYIKDNVPIKNKIKEEKVVNYFIKDNILNFNKYMSVEKEQNLYYYEKKKNIKKLKLHRKKQKNKVKIIHSGNIRKKKNEIKKKKIEKLNRNVGIKILAPSINLEKEVYTEEKKKVEDKTIKEEKLEYLQETNNIEKKKMVRILDNSIEKANAGSQIMKREDVMKKIDEIKCKDIKNFLFEELKNELFSSLFMTNGNKSNVCNYEYIGKNNNLKLDKNIKSDKQINKNITNYSDFLKPIKCYNNKEAKNHLKRIKSVNSKNFLIYKKKKALNINKKNSKNNSKKNETLKNIVLKTEKNKILLKNNVMEELKLGDDNITTLALLKNDSEDLTKNKKDNSHESSNNNNEQFNNIRKNIIKEEYLKKKNYSINNSNSKDYITIRILNKQDYKEKQNVFKSNKFYSLSKKGSIIKELEDINKFSKSKIKGKKENFKNVQAYKKEIKRKNNIFHKNINETSDKKVYKNENSSFFPILHNYKNMIYIEEYNSAYIYLANNLNNAIYNIFKYKNKILFFHIFLYSFNIFLFYELLNNDLIYKQDSFATKETVLFLFFMILELYVLFLNNAIYFFLRNEMKKAISTLDKINLIYSLNKIFPRYCSFFKKYFSILEDIDCLDEELKKKEKKKIMNSNSFGTLSNANCIIKNKSNLDDIEKLNNRKENNTKEINKLDKLNNLDLIYNNEEKKKNKKKIKKNLKELLRKKDKLLNFKDSENCKDIYVYPSNNNENIKYFNDKIEYEENDIVYINEKIKQENKINFNYSKSEYKSKKNSDKKIFDFMFFILNNQKNLNLDKFFFFKVRKYANYLIIFSSLLLFYITTYFKIKDPSYFSKKNNYIFFIFVSCIIFIQIFFCIIIEIKNIFVDKIKIFLNKRITNLEYQLYIYMSQVLE